MEYHPFRFLDYKEQATIRRQPAGGTVDQTPMIGKQFYIDFGFMRASTSDFSRPDPKRDRVISSFDGFNSYILIVDEASRHVWVLFSKLKEPPVDEVSAFLTEFGLAREGLIHCDRGGELARSKEFVMVMQRDFWYKGEPTSADGANQNGGVERWVEGWKKDPNLGFSPPLTGPIDPMLFPLRHAFEPGY